MLDPKNDFGDIEFRSKLLILAFKTEERNLFSSNLLTFLKWWKSSPPLDIGEYWIKRDKLLKEGHDKEKFFGSLESKF